MDIENLTPFPHLTFPTIDQNGVWFETCVVRGTFRYVDGKLIVSDQQESPNLVDSYYGDPRSSSLRTEHDRIPQKQCGEIYFVDPVSRPPTKSNAHSDWRVDIRVGSIAYTFQVCGPCRYAKNMFGVWSVTKPSVCDSVEVRFENAFGGTNPENIRDYHDANPIGRGFKGMRVDGCLAPQVLSASVKEREAVAGLTPVSRAWAPRRKFAGTFDKKWLDERWPLLPLDFDEHFYQQAPGPLQLSSGFFRGDEEVQISGIGKRREYQFRLPEPRELCLVFVGDTESDYTNLKLDTVIFNLETEIISLIWRSSYTMPDWATDVGLYFEGEDDE